MKKIIVSFVTGSALVAMLFPFVEPAIVKALTVTDDVLVTQVVTEGISITAPADITMTPLSTSQNTAVGSADWNVTTNAQAGYNLSIKTNTPLTDATTTEAFTDYTEAVAGTPETWSVATAYEFGYSVRGENAAAEYGTDTDCINGADVPSATLNWEGFATADNQIASTSTVTSTSGATTTVCIATEQNGVFAPAGTYHTTITATAVTQ